MTTLNAGSLHLQDDTASCSLQWANRSRTTTFTHFKKTFRNLASAKGDIGLINLVSALYNDHGAEPTL